MPSACEIAIYQDVDGITGFGPQALRDALAVAGPVSEIHVRLNSQGGNVVDGLAIYNILRQHPARKIVHVDGMALSIASVVMCAGDEIEVAENSWVMIHNPHNSAAGTPDDLREMADLLDKMRDQIAGVYQKRSGRPVEEVLALMDAETWMTGSEAVAAGFADRTSTPLAVAATFDARRFSHAPTQGAIPMASATFQELKAAFPRASAEFIVNAQASNFSLDQARAAYDEATAAALSEAIAEANKAKAELQQMLLKKQEDEEAACKAKADAEAAAKAAAEAKAKTGVKPLASSEAKADGGPADAWREAVAAKIASGMPKAKAHSAVARENPELHAAYVAAVNAR